jgi:hypothetical protein
VSMSGVVSELARLMVAERDDGKSFGLWKPFHPR